MKSKILKRPREMDTPVNRTAVRVGAVLFSVGATFFFCRSMISVPVEDMIALTKIPPSGIDIAQLQRMTQQRADSQIGILLLVIGAMFSILSASLPGRSDDNMNWKAAIWTVIIVGMFLAASVYISSRLNRSAYKKAVASACL